MRLLNDCPERDWSMERSESHKYFTWVLRYYKEGGRVLDIGAGQGHLVNLLRERKINAIGVDARVIYNPYVIQADSVKLPFENETFDIITEFFCLQDMIDLQHDFSSIEPSVLEAKRCLKKGGVLICSPTAYRFAKYFDEKLCYSSADSYSTGIFRK